MAGRRAIVPRFRQVSQVPVVDSVESAARAVDIVADALDDLQSQRLRCAVSFDLTVGTNRVQHGLGRPYMGYTITPTAILASFAHALSTTHNPRPDLEVWIDVIGAAQPDARIEIFAGTGTPFKGMSSSGGVS